MSNNQSNPRCDGALRDALGSYLESHMRAELDAAYAKIRELESMNDILWTSLDSTDRMRYEEYERAERASLVAAQAQDQVHQLIGQVEAMRFRNAAMTEIILQSSVGVDVAEGYATS